jgi:hypothetical protein
MHVCDILQKFNIYVYTCIYIGFFRNLPNIIRHIESYVAIRIYIFLIFLFRGILIFVLLLV